jgi:hypothetical protein
VGKKKGCGANRASKRSQAAGIGSVKDVMFRDVLPLMAVEVFIRKEIR